MKALLYLAPRTIQLVDLPEPKLTYEDGIKVRIDYCAMCATDLHIVTMGLYNLPTPWLLGHEMMGTIVELTDAAKRCGFDVGDKVIVNQTGHCGVCDECKRGNDVFCTNKFFAGGGFTEFIIARPINCYKIPADSGVDPMYYALAEPMASAVQGIDLAQINIGDSVLLSGCGAIGSILLNMLLLQGCTNVTVSDPVPEKRELALAMGAQHVVDPFNEDMQARTKEITGGRGYDVIFDAAGVPKAAPGLLKLMANKGTIVYFAVFPMDYELPLNLYELYMKEGRLQTVYTSEYNYPRVIDLVPRMQMEKIVTKVMPLSQAEEAFWLFQEGKNNKIIVKCSDYE